jgi:transcription elongation factor
MINDKRKHYTQMSEKEIRVISLLVKSSNFKLNDYSKFRMNERNVTVENLVSAIRKGEVIEVHNNVGSDIRVLLRDDRGNCAVVSLMDKKVVTCFKNNPNDNHATINRSLYTWNENLIPILKDKIIGRLKMVRGN